MSELSAFHDVRFPLSVSFGATGGPERRNEIVSLQSGHERRNARHAFSRRRYDAGSGLRSLDDLHAVMAFFEARRGSLHAFRFRDPFDMRSCPPGQKEAPGDQVLGAGDGSQRRFALGKSYGEGENAVFRPIRKPVIDTLRVAVGGAEIAAFSFDDAVGEIVFSVGHEPGSGEAVTAGFEFDVPVRFDTDALDVTLDLERLGSITSIPLLELRR